VLRAALNNRADSIAILSVGTDGIDGHSPAAGALADETTLPRAAALHLAPEDYLQRSDSFHFFNALGDAIVIGPTGNNVRDVRICLA
jgi:hydroxypyruvate reductase